MTICRMSGPLGESHRSSIAPKSSSTFFPPASSRHRFSPGPLLALPRLLPPQAGGVCVCVSKQALVFLDQVPSLASALLVSPLQVLSPSFPFLEMDFLAKASNLLEGPLQETKGRFLRPEHPPAPQHPPAIATALLPEFCERRVGIKGGRERTIFGQCPQPSSYLTPVWQRVSPTPGLSPF